MSTLAEAGSVDFFAPVSLGEHKARSMCSSCLYLPPPVLSEMLNGQKHGKEGQASGSGPGAFLIHPGESSIETAPVTHLLPTLQKGFRAAVSPQNTDLCTCAGISSLRDLRLYSDLPQNSKFSWG